MLNLKYIGSEDFYQVSFKSNNKSLVTITGDFPVKRAGFKLYKTEGGKPLGDYSSFVTIYKELEDGAMFSNDGSIYIEPEIIEPVEPEPPTEEELAAMFEARKVSKINESKALLANYLEAHPLVSDCHGGIEAIYTVTTEKQTLMASNYLTYTIAKQSGIENPVLTWNAAGCECEVWTEEEYVSLVLQVAEYVKPLVALQQSFEVQIGACETQEELDGIEIVYDVYGISE